MIGLPAGNNESLILEKKWRDRKLANEIVGGRSLDAHLPFTFRFSVERKMAPLRLTLANFFPIHENWKVKLENF
jgi:hypothetical protein